MSYSKIEKKIKPFSTAVLLFQTQISIVILCLQTSAIRKSFQLKLSASA